MSKLTTTSYKKGDRGNPNGRPKGSLNKFNQLRFEFARSAETDLIAAYEELRAAMKTGEGWAHQIFWKYMVPKRMYKDTVIVDCSGDKLSALLDGLKQFQELTYEEVLDGIKALSSVKLEQKIEEIEAELSNQEKKALINKINFFVEHHQQENRKLCC